MPDCYHILLLTVILFFVGLIRAQSEFRHTEPVRIGDILPVHLFEFRMDGPDSEEFAGLVDSIRKHGLIQPVVVRPSRSVRGATHHRGYELVSGYRRFAALRKLGYETIPCVIMDLDDKGAFEVALVENIQRRSLDPIEEAEAFKSYVLNFGRGSVTRLARRVGRSEEYVSHRLLLLGLPKAIQDKISRRLLKPSHATELVWIQNHDRQVELGELIEKHNLSVGQVRFVARMLKSGRVSAEEATLRAMSRCPETIAHKSLPDSWTDFTPSEGNESEHSDAERILDRSILVVRTSLAGMDLLIQKANHLQLVSDYLLDKRQRIHTILDELITAKVSLRRRGEFVVPVLTAEVHSKSPKP